VEQEVVKMGIKKGPSPEHRYAGTDLCPNFETLAVVAIGFIMLVVWPLTWCLLGMFS
jgi:hypothetical protein